MRRTDATAGYSLIELVVVIALIGTVTSVAMSSFHTPGYELDAATAELVTSVRLTRAFAMSRGAHYRFVIADAASARIERMLERAPGEWTTDGSDVRSTRLPRAVTFATAPATMVEFDTRGRIVGAKKSAALALAGSDGGSRQVTVWPSGQVIRE